MREIKFKVWGVSENRFINPRKVHLDLMEGHTNLKVKLLQYTGLKDKNGKEIYEGDVVREYEDYFSSEPDFIPEKLGDYLVKWDLNGFWLDDRDANEYGFGDLDYMEVIGNIYESPELIK